jgi:hypothetical protein
MSRGRGPCSEIKDRRNALVVEQLKVSPRGDVDSGTAPKCQRFGMINPDSFAASAFYNERLERLTLSERSQDPMEGVSDHTCVPSSEGFNRSSSDESI